MSFSDTFTVDDLHRAHRFREGAVLDRDQVRDLIDSIEDADEVELEAAYEQGRNDAIDQCCKRCRVKLEKVAA